VRLREGAAGLTWRRHRTAAGEPETVSIRSTTSALWRDSRPHLPSPACTGSCQGLRASTVQFRPTNPQVRGRSLRGGPSGPVVQEKVPACPPCTAVSVPGLILYGVEAPFPGSPIDAAISDVIARRKRSIDGEARMPPLCAGLHRVPIAYLRERSVRAIRDVDNRMAIRDITLLFCIEPVIDLPTTKEVATVRSRGRDRMRVWSRLPTLLDSRWATGGCARYS
jgi:hypothetical protein